VQVLRDPVAVLEHREPLLVGRDPAELHGQRSLAGEGVRHAQLGVGERHRALVAHHRQEAEDAAARREGHQDGGTAVPHRWRVVLDGGERVRAAGEPHRPLVHEQDGRLGVGQAVAVTHVVLHVDAVAGHDAQDAAIVAAQEERGVGVRHGGRLAHDHVRCRLRLGARQELVGDPGRGGQPLLAAERLLEQPRVLDRDAGRRGQRHHQLLVALGEGAAVLLLGEVQVAEHLAAHQHRHAEERAHRWVAGREPAGGRVPREVGEADGCRLVDQQAQDALAARQVADAGAGVRVDADGHELDEVAALGAEDAERGVLRVGQVRGELGDPAQRVRQAQVARDREHGVEQPVHLLLGVEDLLGTVDELTQQGVEP
jgi:hypothetical protein